MNSWTADMADTFARCFIREDRYKLLISGIGVTIKVSIVAVILGILIGFLIALCNLSKNKFLRAIGKDARLVFTKRASEPIKTTTL